MSAPQRYVVVLRALALAGAAGGCAAPQRSLEPRPVAHGMPCEPVTTGDGQARGVLATDGTLDFDNHQDLTCYCEPAADAGPGGYRWSCVRVVRGPLPPPELG